MINAYQVNFNGQKIYFEWSFAGLKAIQKLAEDFNVTLKYKCVKVDNTKQLISL